MFTIPDSHGLLELATRATVLLAVALALAWLVRRRPARIRHLMWTTTFALLLGLPALSLFGPAWEVPLLRAPAADTPDLRPATPSPATPIVREPTTELIPPPPPNQPSPNPASPPMRAAEPPTSSHSLPLPFLLWGLGCATALISLLVGMLRFGRLVRHAEQVHDLVWLGQAARVRARLNIRSDVPLYLSARANTPMTGGFRRPAILLPDSAKAWSAARRQAVLTHELIHVRRRDALRQLILRAALALYWFHPLAWVAARLAASAREEACDEEVLALGTRPSRYAGHLLAVAAGGMNPGPSALSLPMVRYTGSRLDRRIASILDPRQPRRSTILTAVVLAAIGVVGVSASVAHPVRIMATGGTKVRIVENARPPDGSRLGWRIGPRPLVSIGGGDGGNAALFSDATDATILRDGRIVVADRGTSELRVFDRSGTHVATWGGKGWGGGRFTDLFRIEPFPGDSIVAWSWRQGSMQVLDSEGEFGRILRPERAAVNLLLQRYFLAQARKDPHAIFGRSLAVELWGDLLVVSPTDRYEIMAFANDGTLARVVRRDHRPRRPSRAQVDAYVEAQAARTPGGTIELRAKLRAHDRPVPVADHLPAFGTVMSDALGHLWVEEYAAPGEEMSGSLWTVFDPEGHVLGYVATPPGLQIHEIGEDYILGRVHDVFGVESIQVWPLERSSG